MSGVRLSPLDLAFWHAETDDHPLHLAALAVLAPAEGMTAQALVELLARRVAAIPRLRQRVSGRMLPPGSAEWRDDPDFDPARHLHVVATPGGVRGPDPVAALAELMERPVDPTRPPWEIHVAESTPGGPFLVLVKLHHALADGLSTVRLGFGLFDEAVEHPRLARLRPTRPRPARPSKAEGPRATRLPQPFSMLEQRLGQVRRPVDAALARLGEAGRAMEIMLATARASVRPLGPSGLGAASSSSRRLGIAALDLDDIRRIRKVTGGTDNDVLLAVVSGMLRSWLQDRGEDPHSAPRALIPVAQRSGSASGNRISGYLTELPVHVADPLERLRAVRAAMDERKAAGPNRGAGAITLLADYVPPMVSRLSGPLAGHTARFLYDILVTSVPVPDIPLTLGGCRLLEVYPLPPLARGQALAVGLSAYRGRVHLGLVADGLAVPDLDRVAAAAHEELGALREASGVA